MHRQWRPLGLVVFDANAIGCREGEKYLAHKLAQRSAAVHVGNAAAISLSLAQRNSSSLQLDSARPNLGRLQLADYHDQAAPAATEWSPTADVT